MTYDAAAIANYFLDLARKSGEIVDPMKLQKLVYYAHGWYAGQTGEPLIDESIEAWPYGPVIRSLYHEFKHYGGKGITGKATEFGDDLDLVEVPAPTDPKLTRFLDAVWKAYGKYTGPSLSEKTHAPGGPWDVTRQENPGIKGPDISFETIRKHFAEAVQRSRAKAKAESASV